MTTYTTRAAAGAAYQVAAQSYFDQWVELAAWDRANNASASGHIFSAQPEIAPHGEFLQMPPGNTHDPVRQRHMALEVAGGLVKQSAGGPGAQPAVPASPAAFPPADIAPLNP